MLNFDTEGLVPTRNQWNVAGDSAPRRTRWSARRWHKLAQLEESDGVMEYGPLPGCGIPERCEGCRRITRPVNPYGRHAMGPQRLYERRQSTHRASRQGAGAKGV